MKRTKWPWWLQPGESGGEIIVRRAELVRRIFALAEKGLSATEIMQMFLREDTKPIPPTRIGGWHRSIINNLLSNRATYGYSVKRDGSALKVYKPIITKELFDKVQRVRRTHIGGKVLTSTKQNLFKNLLICGHCASNVNGVARHTIKFYGFGAKSYIVCTNKCFTIRMSYKTLEAYILGHIEDVRADRYQPTLEYVPNKGVRLRNADPIRHSIEEVEIGMDMVTVAWHNGELTDFILPPLR